MQWSKYWQFQADVADRAKMITSILTIASLFIDRICNFFYQNDQRKKLYKLWMPKTFSENIIF
jgi:hypothetical protein